MNPTSRRLTRRALAATTVVAAAFAATGLPVAVADGAPAGHAREQHLRDVLIVANSLDGTVSVIDTRSYRNVRTINVIPDFAQRLQAINSDPTGMRQAYYYGIKAGQVLRVDEPGQGTRAGDRLVDDLFVSPDGATLYVSRGNLGDIAAFDLVDPSHPMKWRRDVAGWKADHAALSPDGSRLVVSATLGSVAQIFDTATGTPVGYFPTGTYPHQNDYSRDGSKIYNASIGTTAYPFALNHLKGARQLTVADANTGAVLRTYQFDFGIRPSAFTADEQTMYAQLSYKRGLVKFDLVSGAITDQLTLPASAHGLAKYPHPDLYPQNSASHGLDLSNDGDRLCHAGTIDNYVSIISTATLTEEARIDGIQKPYWSTTSPDGKDCLVSESNGDSVAVIDYEHGTLKARIPVGDLPQRSQLARIDQHLWAGDA